MTITDELRVIIEAEVERAVRDMDKWDDAVNETEKKLEALEKAADKMSKRLMLVSGGFAAVGGAGLKFAADIETQRVALEVLTGSAETASKVFGEWQQFAAKTPLSMDDITGAGTQLLNFGTNVKDVTATLKTLGDVSMGNSAKLDTVVRAYGRMQMKGKATMEELNMLTEAGVPILDQLSKGMGVATDEIFKMAATGQVSFSDVETALAALTGEGGKFHDMLERQSATLSGKLSTALDNLKISAAKVMETVVPMAKDLLDSISGLAENFQKLDIGTRKTIVSLLAVGVAAGPIAKTGTAAIGLVKALSGFATMNPVILGIGAVTLAVAGLAGAFVSAKLNAEKVDEALLSYKGKGDLIKAELGPLIDVLKEPINTSSKAWYEGPANAADKLNKVRDALDGLDGNMKKVLRESADFKAAFDAKDFEAMLKAVDKIAGNTAITPKITLPPVAAMKKTWQSWWEEITKVDQETFKTGSEAAAKYLAGMETELNGADIVGMALGEKIDPLPYLEKNRDAIKETLLKLYSIDPSDIDQKFNFFPTADESGIVKMDDSVKALIDRYQELSEKIDAATFKREKLAKAEELSKRAADLVKTIETPLDRYKSRLAEIEEIWKNQAFEGQLLNEEQLLKLVSSAADDYRAELAAIEKQKEDIQALAFDAWLENLIEDWLKSIKFTNEAAAAFAKVGAQIAMIGIDGLVDSLHDLGIAWAEGAISAEDLGDALAQIGQMILDQLPMLFVQAGLALLSNPATQALGIGLIFGGLASSIIAGYVDGKTTATANAKGNIFDSGAIRPFAQGGAFTNGIVNRETFFDIGKMGEAGPEAVVPLARMSDGSLGVASSGGASASPTYVTVKNYTGAAVKTRERTTNGIKEIEMIVGSIVDSNISGGRHDKALGGRYGLPRRGIRG